jgi:uncharacterized membrane protein SirB2
MAIGLEVAASSILDVLSTIAPAIATILIILGGIIYGLAQTQPPEIRGKWQAAGISMVIGGIIVAAITFAASSIESASSNLLTST